MATFGATIRYENFSQICRICLMHSKDLRPLYTKHNTKLNETLSKIINVCLGIKLNKVDELPSSICSACLKKVLGFNNFRKQCTSNEYKLQSILSDHKEKSLLREIAERIENNDESDAEEHELIEYIEDDAINDIVLDGDEAKANDAYEISLEVVRKGTEKDAEAEDVEHEGGRAEIKSEQNNVDNDGNQSFEDVTDDEDDEEADVANAVGESNENDRSKTSSAKRGNRSAKRQECRVCGKFLVNLRPHMETHEELRNRRKPYQCKYCGKEFLQRAQFDGHVNKLHTGLKPFKCDQCGKTFHGRPSLRMHKIQHSSVRRFKCEFCPNSYLYAHHLSYHRYTHTKERVFPCNICDYTSVHMENLKRHILSKHTEDEDKPYQCEFCSRSFNGQSNMKRHLKRVHNISSSTASAS